MHELRCKSKQFDSVFSETLLCVSFMKNRVKAKKMWAPEEEKELVAIPNRNREVQDSVSCGMGIGSLCGPISWDHNSREEKRDWVGTFKSWYVENEFL